LTQAVTGFFLWAYYSPSTTSAWESVYHVQTSVAGGWFLRGLHHFGAQAFVVLLGLHVLQLVMTRACRVPGELAFWIALLLLPLAVGLSVTGWMLPYDQHGFWAARVPMNILSITPLIGESMRVGLLGGSDVSHLTLTRFLAMHAGLLPLLMLTGLALHWILSWRRIRRDVEIGHRAGSYWPDQAWRDAVVLASFVGLLVLWVFWRHGAPLGAPADSTQEYAAARPEWFFLWLFQLLKYFRGGTEVWGAVVLPIVVLTGLALTPWIATRQTGHKLNQALVLALLAGMGTLSLLAWREDSQDPVYAQAKQQARLEAERAKELASDPGGIPPDGALARMRRDPELQGPRLFARHCAGCHRTNGHDGQGRVPADPASAPDLYNFASQDWLIGLLDPQRVDGPDYFGGTRFASGKMVRFVKRDVAEFDEAQRTQLRKIITALSAEAALPGQRELEMESDALIEEGRKLLDDLDMRCTECHLFHGYGEDPSGPDLTGYGSREWMMEFIRNPAHERFYGDRNDRMPQFGAEQILDDASIELIVDWLRQAP
jgi:ubiquinol-cytochrome c reductase cytochrome b subunit